MRRILFVFAFLTLGSTTYAQVQGPLTEREAQIQKEAKEKAEKEAKVKEAKEAKEKQMLREFMLNWVGEFGKIR